MLKSIRWLRNHGVLMTFSGGNGSRRFVPPDGELTIGQARRLMGLGQMRLYRLHEQGKIRLNTRGKVAMVPLAELRKLHTQT